MRVTGRRGIGKLSPTILVKELLLWPSSGASGLVPEHLMGNIRDNTRLKELDEQVQGRWWLGEKFGIFKRGK